MRQIAGPDLRRARTEPQIGGDLQLRLFHVGGAVSLAIDVMMRQLVFTIALGILFGLLVMVSANLHYAGAIHAWINWLLLGAAPHYVGPTGEPALPSGTYIGLTLILAFVLAFAMHWLREITKRRQNIL